MLLANVSPQAHTPFDTICAKHGIEQRLIKSRHPQTNGMIERFNGWIQEVLANHPLRLILRPGRYHNALYPVIIQALNPAGPLGHITPIQALKNWRKKRPELFNKCVYNQAGLDIFLKLDTL